MQSYVPKMQCHIYRSVERGGKNRPGTVMPTIPVQIVHKNLILEVGGTRKTGYPRKDGPTLFAQTIAQTWTLYLSSIFCAGTLN